MEVPLVGHHIEYQCDNVCAWVELLQAEEFKVLSRRLHAGERVGADALVVLLSLVGQVDGGLVNEGLQVELPRVGLERVLGGTSLGGLVGGALDLKVHGADVLRAEVRRTTSSFSTQAVVLVDASEARDVESFACEGATSISQTI